MYRTDFLRSKRLCFPEKVCWEDTVFMPKALLQAERVAAVPDVLYSYRVNADSISGSFARAYPAKLIYEYAFCAGGDLLHFSDKVRDEELRSAFRNTAVGKYINGFSIHLFRTSKSERKKFYGLVYENETMVKQLKEFMSWSNRLLLSRPFGSLFLAMLSFVYQLKHGK